MVRLISVWQIAKLKNSASEGVIRPHSSWTSPAPIGGIVSNMRVI